MDPTTSSRVLNARIAAAERWAHEPDRSAATAPARSAFDARFEREVDPDGILAPDERAKRAASAKKAYFLRLALKSAESRRRRAGSRERLTLAAELRAAADDLSDGAA